MQNLQIFGFNLTKNQVIKRKGLEVINTWIIPAEN